MENRDKGSQNDKNRQNWKHSKAENKHLNGQKSKNPKVVEDN